MKIINSFIVLCSLCLLTACRSYQTTPIDEPFKKVLAKFTNSDTSAYRLDSLLDVNWDRLMILTPSYNRRVLKLECGIVSALPDSKIDGHDDSDEYLFVKRGSIISHHVTSDKVASVILVIAGSPTCGIENTSKTFIKQIPNDPSRTRPDWKGKTFMIFLKD